MEDNAFANKSENDPSPRPPIIVVMGHIDHGKTTLLDTIRKSKAAEKESGGITQHIGAYEVEHKGKKITFIDTPGHEAFSHIRSRGARVADLAVLVIAADEGVKPQTKEAIALIQETGLPFIVAFNKMDKPDVNLERVKSELAKENVLVESYGGKIPSVEISAKEGKNIDELLETLLLMAELEGLEGHPEKDAHGVVIDAYRDPQRGPTATLLIHEGTLQKEKMLVIGRALESMKIVEDFQGNAIEHAGPSSPVRIAGLSKTPRVGEHAALFPDKTSAETFLASLPEEAEEPGRSRPDKQESRPVFHAILKADVAGSLEALEETVRRMDCEAVCIDILWSGIGDIAESDVKRAMATRSVTIVGFRVNMDPVTKDFAQRARVRVVSGDVIYNVLLEVKEAIEDVIPPEVVRTHLGRVNIIKLFSREGTKQIVGGRVEEGIAKKKARVRVFRAKESVGEGVISELQREKVPVDEVKQETECGLLVDSRTPIEAGDILEVFEEEIVKKSLNKNH